MKRVDNFDGNGSKLKRMTRNDTENQKALCSIYP